MAGAFKNTGAVPGFPEASDDIRKGQGFQRKAGSAVPGKPFWNPARRLRFIPQEDGSMIKDSDRITDAPAAYGTARRPGQPGDENKNRAGPNPRSAHPTGPHAPYEPDDPEGLAAEKHHSEPVEVQDEAGGERKPSGTIRIVDLAKASHRP